MSELAQAIAALAAAHTVSVAFVDLQTGERVQHDAQRTMHAASTMKLPVLLAAHRLAAEKRLDLDVPVRVENRFPSLVDGSPFSVDQKDDTDDWMYTQLGRTLPLRKLLERMIVRSSNLATDLVMERVPAAEVQKTCDALGAGGMRVLRGVEDGTAHARGLDNTTSAEALARLLEASASMPAVVELLAAQELNEGIPAALPPGTRVAHKTGSITRHYHDAALIYPGPGRKPYVLVVMTKDFEREEDAIAVVRNISRTVWTHVVDAGRQTH